MEGNLWKREMVIIIKLAKDASFPTTDQWAPPAQFQLDSPPQSNDWAQSGGDCPRNDQPGGGHFRQITPNPTPQADKHGPPNYNHYWAHLSNVPPQQTPVHTIHASSSHWSLACVEGRICPIRQRTRGSRARGRGLRYGPGRRHVNCTCDTGPTVGSNHVGRAPVEGTVQVSRHVPAPIVVSIISLTPHTTSP